ncbi:MAG: pirin family protein [Pseudomonadota bacterium]
MKQLREVSRQASGHWVGDGFPVRQLVSIERDAASTSPFLMLDHAGPREFPPAQTPRGVGAHPHRGFETVTIVYHGEVEHRDTAGNSGVIGPGDVQWMTAASGVLHDEFHSRSFTARGGVMEMAQLWVNLPARHKMDAPRYQGLTTAQIPSIELAQHAGQVRVIAGEYQGMKGPAQTFSPMNVLDLRLKAGHAATFDAPEGWNAMLVVLHGAVEVEGQKLAAEEVAHYGREGKGLALKAVEDTTALILSGQPLDEPIAHYGPFVMNTQQELKQAFADYNSGRFGHLA